MLLRLAPLVSFALAMPTLAAQQAADQRVIPYEKHVLDNGLEVVLHEDHSDPVVGVFVYYHVGSSREEPGKSGFAHLFEHMLFQGSEHVGDDQHFKLIQEAGGTLNGTTNVRTAPTTSRRCPRTSSSWRCGSSRTAWVSCCPR